MTTEGIDCLAPVGAVAAAELAATGIIFVCRSIGAQGALSLTTAELDCLHAAGLDVVLVYETTGVAARGGAAAGTAIGVQAATAAMALGAPRGTAVYVAETDFGVLPEDVPAVQSFYAAAHAQLRLAGFRSGAYGGLRVAAALPGIVDCIWQTYAWSTGNWFSGSTLEQYQNGVVIAGVTCDRDRALVDDFGQWRRDAPPQPQHEDDEMSMVIIGTTNGQGQSTGTYLVDTATGAACGLTADNAPQVPHVSATDDEYNKFVAQAQKAASTGA